MGRVPCSLLTLLGISSPIVSDDIIVRDLFSSGSLILVPPILCDSLIAIPISSALSASSPEHIGEFPFSIDSIKSFYTVMPVPSTYGGKGN